jgi:glycosyltransferase involved in cell wall biosynthesis
MSFRILMMSSIPLSAPWNGADKNFARLLVQTDQENQYRVNTGQEDSWAENVLPIRTRSASSMPTLSQKIRSFGYLVRYSMETDLVHIIASLKNPSRLSSDLLRLWKFTARQPVIHTIPSIGDAPVNHRNFVGDVTVVVSNHSRRKLVEHGVSNVQRVYPPLDDRSIRLSMPSEQVSIDLGLGPRPVLYPAHYGSKSGIWEMIRAFALLPEEFHDAVLVLACRAHPSQDAAYEAHKVTALAKEMGISDRVRVVGNFPDMAALISACAITALVPGLLDSKMDLPLVILESLALKRPVIISDQPPMDEALLGGGGLKVRFGDIPGLSSALTRLLSDSTLRERLAAQGSTAVLQQCHPRQIVTHYRQIYLQAFRTWGALKSF